MADTPLGRLCWFELMTTDPDAAPDFYGPIAGWGSAPWGGGENEYFLWMNGEAPLGGFMKLPKEASDMGAPPHWLVHISTPDLDATVAKIGELGGTVMKTMEIPSVGRFAIVRDPQGAYFSAFEPEGDAPGHDGPPRLGEVSWHELATTDWEAAWSFYSGVFGWQKTDAMDMGEMGMYQMWGRGAHPLGGMMNKPPQMPMAAWLFYIHVPDADAAAAKATELGGKVLNGPMEVPGGDRVAQLMDAQGAAIAVHSRKPA